MEESWREHGAYIRNAQGLVAPALAANLETLAGSVAVEGPRIVVFNPLPWTRDDVITLDAVAAIFSGLKDAASGETVAVERTGGNLRFIARRLPPMGHRTYVPAEAADSKETLVADAAGLALENGRFRVKLQPARGVVASLVDKQSGRELVDTKSKYGLGQYLYERFDADINQKYLDAYCKYQPSWVAHLARFDMPPASEVPYSANSPQDFAVELIRGEVSVTGRMTTAASDAMPHNVALDVTLYAGQPFVDLEWRITDKPPETWPEAGWLCLPLAAHEPKFRLGRLGAPIDPSRDIVAGSNHEVFCLNAGMTIAGSNGQAVGLCSPDTPLVSLGHPGVYRHTKQWSPREPVIFVNLFTNVWGTNFQQWIAGSWSARVRLWPAEGDCLEAELITPSWEARNRAKAVVVDGPAGKHSPAQAGVGLSRKGVLVTAFGPNPDGDGLLLRLWEQAGQGGVCTVQLPDGLNAATAQPCDLRGGLQGSTIAVRNGRFEINLEPYAPRSLVLTMKR
jgi:hypothetical protein